MGIDAEILVRGVRRDRVDEETLTALSWRLCESVGAAKFLINDGLPAREYEAANMSWHRRFNAHALHPEYERLSEQTRGGFLRRMTDEEAAANRLLETQLKGVHERILKAVGPTPEMRRRAVEMTRTFYRDDEDEGRPPGSVYTQDGDDVVAEPDECLLQVHLWGRYYGPGYERGDILTYCAIAEWLEVNLHPCTVWYGGDSSGMCVSLFDEAARTAMRRHLYSSQGRDYYRYSERANALFPERHEHGKPDSCGLCPGGKYRGQRYGSGPQFAAYSCAGCGVSMETHDGGKTWAKKKEEA